MATLRLISLVCNATEDWSGADEIYLLVKGNKIWGPESMDTSPPERKTKDLSEVQSIDFAERARLDLYDEDTGFLDDDDHLGTSYAFATEAGQGTKERAFTGDGASYLLTYEVS